MNVNNEAVKFQVDTGSSVNILPLKYADANLIKSTQLKLKTWNNDKYEPVGECRIKIVNPKNKKRYSVNFVVCHNEFMPILGLNASKQMNLIEINDENFEQVNKISENKESIVFSKEVGKLDGEQKLKIKENAQPSIMPDRRIAIAQRQPLKSLLDKLTEKNIIVPEKGPTEWVSQIVLAKKENGDLRLCIDPKELNKVLVRERYTLPTIEDKLHELSQSKFFSKTDVSSGYWHVELDETSSKLTTFQTCHGRYRWLRLPFGLSVSSEIFQRKLNEALYGLKGVTCVADDIIIHAKTESEHDENWNALINRCYEKGIKLNKKKTQIKVDSLVFMGHQVSKEGLKTDPAKVHAIQNFPTPQNVSQLRSFLGIVNFVSKFIPNLSEIVHPLHNLLKKDVNWSWSKAQEESFKKVKSTIATETTLILYDPNKAVTIENDASDYGIGSVLLQDNKPIAYASRSLSECEKRYAQIEKEMLAIVFGLQKFHHYVYGRQVKIITDHKPLTSIVLKNLSKAPKRLQSMLLKIQDYNYSLDYKPGTSIPIADALSRGPLPNCEQVNVISNLENSPLTSSRFLHIKNETEKDPVLIKLKKTIAEGWPNDKQQLDDSLRVYFNYRDEMTIEDGIVLRGERIVIPKSLRYDMKQKLHAGHLGINSCLRRARTYLYWPGMSSEIRNFIETCPTCNTIANKQPKQPLKLHDFPERPWQKLGIDIFTIENRNYLVTVDYYSQFFEVDYLSNDMTSATVISKLKAHFARYGIPEHIISDNGPQLVSKEFRLFTNKYNIKHDTSSPGNSQSNGEAEAAVKIAKRLMKKSKHSGEDPYIALLNYRNTPQEGLNYSPAQKLMGRRTRTLLPTTKTLLDPATIDDKSLRTQKEKKQETVASKFINRRELPTLSPGQKVRMQPIQSNVTNWKEARVNKQLSSRSYEVTDEAGNHYRRNRQHLREQKQTPETTVLVHLQEPIESAPAPQHHTSDKSRTRSGRVVKKPARFDE